MRISKSVFLISFIFFLLSVEVNANVIRAAIDFGTAGPKLRIAEIDLENNKIVKLLHSQQFPVNFQTALARDKNNCITQEIMEEGLIAFKKAITVAHEYGVDGIVTVGASLFRIADNAQEFADYIQYHTNIHVHIIDQSTEALLAYQAAVGLIDADPKNVVVWDVGGGSTQFTGIDENGSLWMKNLNHGSGDFRDYVIENIQGHLKSDCLSPNPLSEQDCIKAVS
ncbi:MAG: hypothetical protein JHC93_06385, partial [Parachlamydiales bacterium]|nr:hypothetical protein [Parachlamydiales bacterium]